MKQIMMSFFTFFALTLISCSTDRDSSADKDKCEHKGSDFVWSAEKDKCITKTQKECEEKSKDNVYNEETKTCETKVNTVTVSSATVLFESKNPNIQTDFVLVTATASQEANTLLDKDNCATVTAEQFKSLKISVGAIGEQKILCDSDDSSAPPKCDELKNYAVYYDTNTAGYKLREADSSAQNCESLESTDEE